MIFVEMSETLSVVGLYMQVEYTAERGTRIFRGRLADLIAFGRHLLRIPDLPDRIANGWPLNPSRCKQYVWWDEKKADIDYPAYTD